MAIAELLIGGLVLATIGLKPEWRIEGVMVAVTLSFAVFVHQVAWPLKKILKEFKALLTGKKYNRIYTGKIDEIGIIAHVFNEITHSLERVSTDIKEHRRMATELNIAQKIQQDLIPQEPPRIPGLDIRAKTKPAAEIGGDAYDFISKNDQSFIYIGDVTGHGVPSGLVMMIVDTLIHTLSDTSKDSRELIAGTNKYLKPRIQTTMFMTMVMLRWEHKTQKMFYTGAGHETILHYKRTENLCESLPSGGIALGMVQDNSALVKEKPLDVNPNDFLVLYSDGIVESKNANGEMVTIERLRKWVEKYAKETTTAEDLFQKISKEVLYFLGEFRQEDDMTLLVIKIDGASPS